jgi:hypothetical protein
MEGYNRLLAARGGKKGPSPARKEAPPGSVPSRAVPDAIPPPLREGRPSESELDPQVKRVVEIFSGTVVKRNREE